MTIKFERPTIAHCITNIIVYHPLHAFVGFHYFTSRYCMMSSFASNQSNKQARLRSQEASYYVYGQLHIQDHQAKEFLKQLI